MIRRWLGALGGLLVYCAVWVFTKLFGTPGGQGGAPSAPAPELPAGRCRCCGRFMGRQQYVCPNCTRRRLP